MSTSEIVLFESANKGTSINIGIISCPPPLNKQIFDISTYRYSSREVVPIGGMGTGYKVIGFEGSGKII